MQIQRPLPHCAKPSHALALLQALIAACRRDSRREDVLVTSLRQSGGFRPCLKPTQKPDPSGSQ